jgi:hypothetical protein
MANDGGRIGRHHMNNASRSTAFRSTGIFSKFAKLTGALALTVACLSCTTAFALINGDYNVMLGESPRYLEAIVKFQRDEITASELYVIKYEESCKNPSIRLWDRNRPAFLVQNTSAVGQANEVSSFTIDLTQAGFEFGTGDSAADGFNGQIAFPNVKTDPGVTITGSSYVAGDTTKVQVNFTGLTRGKFAIFRLDLDPIPMVNVVYPDYRTVILGANGNSPALVSATFSEAGQPNASTPFQAFNGGIQNNIGSGLLEVYHNQSRTEMFDLDGTIPEPSSFVLLAVAGMGLASVRRRSS